MHLNGQRRLFAPLFCNRPVTGRLILNVFAEKSSRISDLGGSNLDANSLQSGSVLNAMQKPKDYEQLQEVKSIKNQ